MMMMTVVTEASKQILLCIHNTSCHVVFSQLARDTMSVARRAEGRVLYNRLAASRIEAGLSRAELADQVGVNVQTIGALERGQYYPSLYVAMLLAEACREELDALFAWDPASFAVVVDESLS